MSILVHINTIKILEKSKEPLIYSSVEANVFKQNHASKNAECIYIYDELKVELWCDKHYHNRRKFGDDNGKREGIEIEGVQDLIVKSFKYLLDIYLRGIPFKFINFITKDKKDSPLIRTVLKTPINDTILNVVVEIHYIETSKFELTVITAMATDNFKVSDGQYSLMINEDNVVLRRKIRNSLNIVYKLDL